MSTQFSRWQHNITLYHPNIKNKNSVRFWREVKKQIKLNIIKKKNFGIITSKILRELLRKA